MPATRNRRTALGAAALAAALALGADLPPASAATTATTASTASAATTDSTPQPVFVDLGGLAPQGLAISPDGNELFFSSTGTGIGRFILDQGIDRYTVGTLSAPAFHLAVGEDGATLWATKFTKTAVSPIGAQSLQTQANLAGGVSPYGVLAGPFGFLWETSAGDDHVQVINAATHQAVTSIPVGDYPTALAHNLSGTRLYVTNAHSNNVSVIDISSLTVVNTIPVGRVPVDIEMDPAGRVAFVLAQGDDAISVIDLSSETVIKTVRGLDFPTGIAVADPDGTLYVSNSGRSDHGGLDVVDWLQGVVTRHIEVGANPSDVVATPDGRSVFVAVQTDHRIAMLDVGASAGGAGGGGSGGGAGGTGGGGGTTSSTSSPGPTDSSTAGPAPVITSIAVPAGGSPGGFLAGVDPLILIVGALGLAVIVILIVLVVVLLRRSK